MQISSNRPAMRSGASSVAFKKPNLQNEQAAKKVTTSTSQQPSNQLQAQKSTIGQNIDFTA